MSQSQNSEIQEPYLLWTLIVYIDYDARVNINLFYAGEELFRTQIA